MEELLNTLIKRGWKPFGWKDIKRANNEGWFVCFVHKTKKRPWLSEVSYRELVSIDSGLWQFVCENRKRGYTIPECWIKNPKICDEGIESVEKECNQNSYEYYIIESALKDESELEQFLLDNIKIEG